MANKKPENLRKDLYCPQCSGKGLIKRTDKAGSGKTRYECATCGHRTTSTLYSKPQILPAFKTEAIKGKKRFIITSAVNDTDLILQAHKTFISMSKRLDAAYMVIPGAYKNPALYDLGLSASFTWPKAILPYVVDADIKLNKHLIVRGKTRIQYTAVNPLQGMNHAGDICSEIFGHPQIAMEMVPTPKEKIPKGLYTTGSMSQKNYNYSVAAKKAEFHHSIGALFVEIEGDEFWITQIRFDGEGVALYDKYYTTRSVKSAPVALGMVYGDIHTRYLSKKTNETLLQINQKLKPKKNVFHDVHDHHIGSHHTNGNKLFALGQNKAQEFSIRKELHMSVDFLDQFDNAVIIDSNHDRHLDQWFNRFKPATDPINIDLYYELGEMCRTGKHENGLFPAYVEKYAKRRHKFVGSNDYYIIADIDVSQHGDRGPNGARGSGKAFAKTGYKTIIGHSHTPRIEKGCYQVGVTSGQQEYAQGYSSWLNCHCIIYFNGKRGILTVINDKLPPLMR